MVFTVYWTQLGFLGVRTGWPGVTWHILMSKNLELIVLLFVFLRTSQLLILKTFSYAVFLFVSLLNTNNIIYY